MLAAIFKVFGIAVSPKCLPFVAKKEMVVAGQYLTAEGYCCSAELEEVIESLRKVKVTGIRQMQHIVGVLEQLHTAVAYTPTTLTAFVDLIAPMTASIKTGKWSDAAKGALEEIPGLLLGLPRAYTHPDYLITGDSCLIMTGDVSDLGAGEATWRVLIPDARHVVVPEDLCDPALARMSHIHANVLSDADQRKLTFENEIKKVVKALKSKAGVRVNALTPYTGDKSDPTYVCKLMVYTDSTYARGAASNLHLPSGEIPFATAKARKLLKWAADIAWTKNYAIEFAHIPGLQNHLSDYLTHIADAMTMLSRDARQSESADSYTDGLNIKLCMPVTRHTYHNTPRVVCDEAAVGEKYPEPVGWETVRLQLNDEQWHVPCAAYRTDDSPIYKVPTSMVYAVATGADTAVAQLERERVLAWKHKIYAISVCKDGTPALFTLQSFLRLDADDDEEPGVPNKLVVIVPKGAQTQISIALQLYDNDDEEHWTFTDLRTDVLLMAHDFSQHAHWEEMYNFVKRFAYWFGLISDIQRHIADCLLCMAKLKAARFAGFGLVSCVCYRHTRADHKSCPPWLSAVTGCNFILTIYDRAHSEIEMVPVETDTAVETCYAIYIHWIKVRGLMRTLVTDQGSGFASEVMKELLRLLGVQVHNFTAAGDSQGMGGTESSNNAASEVITEMGNLGTIKTCAWLWRRSACSATRLSGGTDSRRSRFRMGDERAQCAMC